MNFIKNVKAIHYLLNKNLNLKKKNEKHQFQHLIFLTKNIFLNKIEKFKDFQNGFKKIMIF